MNAPAEYPTRRPLAEITKRYDQVARFYRALESLFLILPLARRGAVAALGPKAGDVVLEIGAGTGRNLPPDLDRAVYAVHWTSWATCRRSTAIGERAAPSALTAACSCRRDPLM
jgi:hypothetical protein